MKKEKVPCADLFCGGGGTSTGMLNAFKRAGLECSIIGVNHWDVAIATNKANHDGTYICDSLETLSPRKVVPGGRLYILCASPECTHHSVANANRPKDEQSRSTAWFVLKWAQEIYIDRIYIENVEEFTSWGPIDENGRPIPSEKGEAFKAYIKAIKAALFSCRRKQNWRHE